MTDKEFFEMYPRTLSDQQMEAALRVDGQTLLLAVPGSGKTTVLIARLGYMLMCKGISPSDILTVTYTVAATKDMMKRFTDTFGEEAAEGLEFRTINGICAKIILEYGRMIEKDPYALQTDEGVLQRAVRDILAETMEEYPADSDVKTARTLITYCKNMMLDPAAIDRIGAKEKMPDLRKVYDGYNTWLRSNRMMDYDDQMVYAYSILCHTPALLKRYRERFRYISVDEAQDTSKIQHEIIRLLTGTDGNLFMVGDEDQSIYGFRAAYPEALLKFTEHHPNGKVIIMDRNFRSGKKIVEASDIIIRNNRMRYEKHMQAVRDTAGTVETIHMNARVMQYRDFADATKKLNGLTAVLCRDNESLVPFVDILDRRKIPFSVKGADISFFTGRVVTDVTNVINLAKNPKDTGLFMKVYYKCKTFLKKQEALSACEFAAKKGLTIVQGAKEANLLPRSIKNLENFFDQLKAMLSEQPYKAVVRISSSLGYSEYLQRIGVGGDRFFVLRAVANGEGTVDKFLARLGYLRELMAAGKGTGKENIVLSTIHSSKGLEYENVFLADVCNGVFPSQPMGDDPMTDEEERRLFYVGLTRAKDHLYLYSYEDAKSTFMKEMREGVKKAKDAEAKAMQKMAVTVKPVYGMLVESVKYGLGTITQVDPKNESEGSILVAFDNCDSEKSFVYPMAFAKSLKVVQK